MSDQPPDVFLGQIELFAFDKVPSGWAPCDGRLLPIAANKDLYALLGTTYGGDGQTTFGLPDLRGRVPLGQGKATDTFVQGDIGGTERVVLTQDQIPKHTHALNAVDKPPATPVAFPEGNFLSVVTAPGPVNVYGSGNAAPMAMATVAPGGQSQSHENRMPFLVLNPCIAIEGSMPKRD